MFFCRMSHCDRFFCHGGRPSKKKERRNQTMRQECRTDRNVQIAHVDGYHHGSHENNLVFVSDRPEKADANYCLLKDGSLPAMYGIELETECWGITDRTIYANVLKHICFSNFHHDLWKIESDCTLDGGDVGAECITQPMTKSYIRNHYRDFKAMYQYFEEFGIDAARTGNCGQHAHISLSCFGRTKKAQDEAIRKLYYIVNRHYELICALLYRRADRQRWCGRMDYRAAWTMNLEYMPGEHSNGFNGSHYRNGNIELRIPGGQKNYACFRNTMESIFHLIEACKTISRKQCDDVTAIFAGCNQHVFDRLNSYCRERGTITAEQLAEIRQTVKTIDFR